MERCNGVCSVAMKEKSNDTPQSASMSTHLETNDAPLNPLLNIWRVRALIPKE